MAGFRKDKTTAAQTSANVAGGVTQSLIAAGLITDVAEAKAAVVELTESLLGVLGPVVDADNALFAEVEAAAPATTSKSKAKSNSAGSGSNDVGSLELNSGKFAGQTIAAVYEMDEETASSQFAYAKGPGSAYIKWLTTQANPNPYTRDKAAEFLASVS